LGPPLSCAPGLWKDTPLDAVAEACSGAQFQGLEQRGTALPNVLASQSQLAESDVKLSAITLHEPWYDRAVTLTHRPSIPELLDGLAAIEPEFCVLSVTGSNERLSTAGWPNATRFDSLSDSEHAILVETVQSVADMMRSVGVQVAFRPRLASFIETEDELEKLLEETEPELLSLALDLGHLALMEVDPMPIIQRHGARITYCYVRDIDEDLTNQIHLGMRGLASAAPAGLFVPPGQGYVSLYKPLQRLLRADTCKWYALDLQPDTVEPREALNITFDYMQESEAWQE
jgi:inosose dehydratase